MVSEIVNEMMEYLRTNITRPISRVDLAEQFVVDGPGQVDAGDFRAERAGERRDVDAVADIFLPGSHSDLFYHSLRRG